MDFEVSADSADGCVVVSLRGECDVGTAPMLQARLLEELGKQPHTVIVDLSGLTFVDCAGLCALRAAGLRARLLGGALAIAAPTAPVTRLLRLTGLDWRLAVFPDTETALAALLPADSATEPGDRAG